MATDQPGADGGFLAPDAAFGLLGSEPRIAILQALGEADEPVSFGELKERVGVDDSGRFNYHLSKLEGHFVVKTEDGYLLRQAGRRIVEAVLSGTLTEGGTLVDAATDVPCPFCGAPVDIRYREELVAMYCTECPGAYGESARRSRPQPAGPDEHGYVGSLRFPPAGLRGREGAEILWAARAWTNAELIAMAGRVCPRCAAPVEIDVDLCEDHDPSTGLCERCDNRKGAQATMRCTNCRHSIIGPLVFAIAADTALLSFLTSHGLNPFDPTPAFYDVVANYEERIGGEGLVAVRLTFAVDGDSISLDVDAAGDVIEVRRAG